MRLELHKAIRPGSPQERRRKLRDVLPLPEQAHDNGWRWSDILEMAREMLGEPDMTLYALKNIRRRYKSLLSPAASKPSFSGAPAQPVPAPIAPPGRGQCC